MVCMVHKWGVAEHQNMEWEQEQPPSSVLDCTRSSNLTIPNQGCCCCCLKAVHHGLNQCGGDFRWDSNATNVTEATKWDPLEEHGEAAVVKTVTGWGTGLPGLATPARRGAFLGGFGLSSSQRRPSPSVSLLGTAPTAYPRCGGDASAYTMGTVVWSSSRAPFRRMLRGMGATSNGIGPACCNELWPQLLVLLQGERRRWWLVPSRPHGCRDYWRRGRVRRCLDGRSRGTVQMVNWGRKLREFGLRGLTNARFWPDGRVGFRLLLLEIRCEVIHPLSPKNGPPSILHGRDLATSGEETIYIRSLETKSFLINEQRLQAIQPKRKKKETAIPPPRSCLYAIFENFQGRSCSSEAQITHRL